MRKALIIIALLFLVAACKKDKPEGPVSYSCDGAIEATSTNRLVAAKLAAQQIEKFALGGRDTVFIPEIPIQVIEAQLLAIKQLDLVNSDSIFNRYRIPENFYTRPNDLRELTIWVRGGAWSDTLVATGRSGDEAFNELMDKFSLKVDAYAKEVPQFGPYLYRLLIKSCQPLNQGSLKREFEKSTLIDRVELVTYNTNTTITISPLANKISRYDFAIWYDCQSGTCKKSHHWIYEVDENNVAVFNFATGDPAP